MHPADSYMCVPTRSPKGDYADKCLPLRPGTSCCPDGYHKVLGSCEHNSEYNETKPYFHSNGSTTTHSQVAGAKATQAHKTAVSQHAPSPATKHNVHKAHAGTWPSIADPPPSEHMAAAQAPTSSCGSKHANGYDVSMGAGDFGGVMPRSRSNTSNKGRGYYGTSADPYFDNLAQPTH